MKRKRVGLTRLFESQKQQRTARNGCATRGIGKKVQREMDVGKEGERGRAEARVEKPAVQGKWPIPWCETGHSR